MSDLDALVRLQAQLTRHHREIQPANPRYHVSNARWETILRRDLETDTALLYVAQFENEVIGFIKVPFIEKPWGLSCEIDTVVVDDSHRGRGVGHRLMTAADDAGREHGAAAIRLTLLAGNHAAKAFYEDLGYKLLAWRYGKPTPHLRPPEPGDRETPGEPRAPARRSN